MIPKFSKELYGGGEMNPPQNDPLISARAGERRFTKILIQWMLLVFQKSLKEIVHPGIDYSNQGPFMFSVNARETFPYKSAGFREVKHAFEKPFNLGPPADQKKAHGVQFSKGNRFTHWKKPNLPGDT